jgi:hypothetical protein
LGNKLFKLKGTKIHKYVQTGAWKGGILKGGIRVRPAGKDVSIGDPRKWKSGGNFFSKLFLTPS